MNVPTMALAKRLYMKNLPLAALSLLLLSSCVQQTTAIETSFDTPLQVALKSMEPGFSEATNFTISQKAAVESPTTAQIEIVQTHVLDDSIQSIMTVFSLSKNNQRWTIDHQSVLQQCRPGRGHTDFSPAPCQ